MLKYCSRVPFQAHWLGYRPSPSASISLSVAGEVLQPSAPPGVHAIPVNPARSLPRSFPGGTAAVGDVASVLRGLGLAAGDEHGSGDEHSASVVRAREGNSAPSVREGPSEKYTDLRAGAKCRHVYSNIVLGEDVIL